MSKITLIEMQQIEARCCLCNRWTRSHWGVPVSTDTGEIIANESDQDWAGKPACERCHDAHATGKYVGQYPRF